MGNPGDGEIDPLTGEQLQRAQLIAGAEMATDSLSG
jgi:hypothetical protein